MKISSAVCFAAVCVFTIPARLSFAQSLTEEEALASALSRSTTVKQIDADLAEKLGDAKTLKTLSNPELEARFSTPVSDEGESSDNEYEIGIAQPFRLSRFGSANSELGQ